MRQKRVHDEDREQDADEDTELADAAVRDDVSNRYLKPSGMAIVRATASSM